jgi:hypothetical protein
VNAIGENGQSRIVVDPLTFATSLSQSLVRGVMFLAASLSLVMVLPLATSIEPRGWNARAAVKEQQDLSKEQIAARLLDGPFPKKIMLHKSEVDGAEIKFSELIFQDVTDWYTGDSSWLYLCSFALLAI